MTIDKDLIIVHTEVLLKEGWVKIEPCFDFNYFITLDPFKVMKSFGYFISSTSEILSKNPLGFLSADIERERLNFLSSICPVNNIKTLQSTSPQFQARYPFTKNDYENQDAAFEELTYIVIQRIIKYLGEPKQIVQVLGEDQSSDSFLYRDTSVNLNNLSILSKLFLVWDDVVITTEYQDRWYANGSFNQLTWRLKGNDIFELASKVCGGIGLELNTASYQLGELNPSFKLDSFPTYIQTYTKNLINILVNKEPERFNVLIQGPPGFGKSAWCQAFASEILSKEGYLIIIIDYNSLQDLVIPDYISKVCIIVNDVDTLALDRNESKKGETEQIMAWLDGTRTSFIKPFSVKDSKTIITLMTANSVERWDKAALRQGRIHKFYTFDQEELCNKNDY
jgi:hypothetical protein